MATSEGTTLDEIVFQRLNEQIDLNDKVAAIKARDQQAKQAGQDVEILQEPVLNIQELYHLMLTDANGQTTMPEQRVMVEYLRNDQRLRIPGALGMSPLASDVGWCATNATLYQRYWKLSTLTYAALKTLTGTATNLADVRTEVDARVIRAPQAAGGYVAWLADDYYALGEGDVDPHAAIVFATASKACQFNCDVRDFGFLLRPDSTVSDRRWYDDLEREADIVRLRSQLHPYTLQCIAALNVAPCANYAFGGWVRAYGLSLGILPNQASMSVPEYMFTTASPRPEDVVAIQAAEARVVQSLPALCANVLALFGLFHLNKDHTFRTGDANMERIGSSYIQTLRTYASKDMLDDLEAHKEVIVRTAPHPFGLAQTYWLARYMGKLGRLAVPLAVRLDATPPPIQRVMIAEAAMSEWAALPAGQIINETRRREETLIRDTAQIIKADPPAYSDLYRLYGLAQQAAIRPDVWKAVKAMMPIIYGYTMVAHVSSDDKRDGLGYALSLKNVERDSKGLVLLWKSAWEKYFSDLESTDLVKIAMQTRGLAEEED